MANVQLEHAHKAFGDVEILHDINLEVRDGEFMVFVGPSGCGKSTLLRVIAGLEEMSGGTLKIGGKIVNEIPPAERGIAMVFQSYALYPHMNLYDNMAFGLKLAKMPKDEIDRSVMSAAKILNIEHLLQRKPKDLSGGQRQRVAIGRAIVRKPEVFLFDEPLSNLDAALRVRMRYEFSKLHKELKSTMIYVTHDQVEAMTLADRIVVLSAGKIEQVGTPLELYEHPHNMFVAGFIGSPKMNFIQAQVVSAIAQSVDVLVGEGVLVKCAVDGSGLRPGDKVTLGVRPEHLRRDAEANVLQSKVSFVESLGGNSHVYAEFPGAEDDLTCDMEGNCGLKEGDTLRIGFAPDVGYLFDSNGLALRRHAAQSAKQAA